MGWSESEGRCKKHPKHRQAPGVCSSCLRERLSQLSSTNNTATISSCSSSLSSSPSSSASSSYSSPIHHRVGSSTKAGPISFLISGNDGLTRSRSMAFVVRNRVEDSAIGVDRKKKGGFWSKLIGSSSKRKKEVLMHSKTVKETRINRLL